MRHDFHIVIVAIIVLSVLPIVFEYVRAMAEKRRAANS